MSKNLRRAQRDALSGSGLGLMPSCSDRDHRAGHSYAALWSRWRGALLQPLRVSAQLLSPYIPAEGEIVHLDAILTGALASSPMVGASVAAASAARVVFPLPLFLAWTSPQGYPLWAATELRPAGEARGGTAYLHKRYPADRADLAVRQTANASAGPLKDVRMPLRTISAGAVEAWCLGDAGDVARLAGEVTHIGRKGAVGFGRVTGWRVEPADVDLAWILQRRAVPLATLGDEPVDASRLAPRGSWTPPYWDATRHAPCRSARWTI